MVRWQSRSGDDRLDHALGQLYDAALDDALWPTALTVLGDLTSSIGGHLLVWDMRQGAPVTSQMGNRFPEVNAEYVAYYSAIDLRLRLVAGMPVGTIFACHHHFDQTFVRRDEFYNDFLLPNGCRYVVGCRLMQRDGVTAVLGLHRSLRHGPFETADLELFGRLLPHVQRAAMIRQQLLDGRADSALHQAALDRLPTAVFVVTGNGAVLGSVSV